MVENSHSEEDKNDNDDDDDDEGGVGDDDDDGYDVEEEEEEEEDGVLVQLRTCRLPVRGAVTATSGLASKDILISDFVVFTFWQTKTFPL